MRHHAGGSSGSTTARDCQTAWKWDPQIGAQKGPLHAYDDPALITLEPEAEG